VNHSALRVLLPNPRVLRTGEAISMSRPMLRQNPANRTAHLDPSCYPPIRLIHLKPNRLKRFAIIPKNRSSWPIDQIRDLLKCQLTPNTRDHHLPLEIRQTLYPTRDHLAINLTL
jgi:hypothetical protein